MVGHGIPGIPRQDMGGQEAPEAPAPDCQPGGDITGIIHIILLVITIKGIIITIKNLTIINKNNNKNMIFTMTIMSGYLAA